MWTLSDFHVPIPFETMESDLAEAARHGVGAEMQGMYEPFHLSENYERNRARVEKAFRGFPGPVSIHGPFMDLNPISPDPGVASLSRRRYEQAFELAEAMGADILLFHSQCSTYIRDPEYLEAWLEKSVTFWEGWKERLQATDRRVVLENVFEPDWKPLKKLLERLDDSRFRACLDTGHAHLFSRDVPAWVEGLASRIAYAHLHDNDGAWDLHRPPGHGNANLAGALQALASLPDRPRINIEIYTREGILEALEWLGAEGFLAGEAA